jgi:guanylate kinase
MESPKGKLFLVAAPSGAGKTTVVQQVVARLCPEYPIHKVVTYTTKQPRAGERQGIEYHFVTQTDFLMKITQGFFVEHSTAYGSYYGFPKEVFSWLSVGRSFIGIVDIAGVKAIRAYSDEVVLIGLRPPTEQILAERLRHRAEDSPSDIAFRLSIAQNELAHIDENFFNYIIINDLLDDATRQLEEIIREELG